VFGSIIRDMSTKIIDELIDHVTGEPSYHKSFVNFVKRLVRNPCEKCIDEMNDFTDKHSFALTKEGYVCGYSTSDKCAFGLYVVPLENAEKEAEFFQNRDLFQITFDPADVLEICDDDAVPFLKVREIKKSEKLEVPKLEASKVGDKIMKKFSGVFEKLANS